MLLFFLVKRHRNKKSKVVHVLNSVCQQLKAHAVVPIQQSSGTDVRGKAHRFTLRSITSMFVIKQALKGFSRVRLSAADNTSVRCVQVFRVVMNTGCYKSTSSFFIIQRPPTTILFWHQSKYQRRRGWRDLKRQTPTITRNHSANKEWNECLWEELISPNTKEKEHPKRNTE